MGAIDDRPGRPKPYRARYWGPDGRQHARYFATKKEAEAWLKVEEAKKIQGTWFDPSHGRVLFADWAQQWWSVYSSNRDLSPATLAAGESHIRLHLIPQLGKRKLRTITPQVVQRWQNDLYANAGHSLTMSCRSLLNRILRAAEDEALIPSNPVPKVRAPKKRADPEIIFGTSKRREFTPEEFGAFLAECEPFYRDHFIVQVGTGLRPGELLGLPRERVNLTLGRLEILEVRFDAGKFGSGYKKKPKSAASIRPVPMSPMVTAAVRRRLVGCPPGARVFPGPGGSNGVPRGARSRLTVGNLRRVYRRAGTRAGLSHLLLKGPHDLRHTYATWLEDAGIPSRVIDELMGHEGGRTDRNSRMGAVYRHTTDDMLSRVTTAIDERLRIALSRVEGRESPAFMAYADGVDQSATPRRVALGVHPPASDHPARRAIAQP